LQAGEHCVRLARRLEQRLHAAVAVDATVAGPDQKGAQSQRLLRARSACAATDRAQRLHDIGKQTLPQRFPQRPDRKVCGLAKADDHGPPGLAVRIEKDSVQANPAGVETKLPSLGKAELERAVQPRFRPGKSVAAVVADEHGKSRERQVPMNDGNFNSVILRLRQLPIVAHHEHSFAAAIAPFGT
jgi:hypothetical protein